MSDTSREAWRQLGAGRELDRVVAEALGEIISFIADDGSTYLEEVIPAGNGWPIEYGSKPMPAYSTSADAALTLPIADYMSWVLDSNPDGTKSAQLMQDLHYGPDYPHRVSEGDGAQYAEAMSKAWLAWRTAEPDRP